ncbi:helix-turn-helix domain-containing protein [Mycobacterium angelicum]|nr:helix-turn-helix domain-containing protein [Mycobacterium angelicum]MCV7196283.1 helix-turn-helix domain-containing protein [Mycobacterium angelicum]
MKLDVAQQKRLMRLYEQGEAISELTTIFGIGRSNLFRDYQVTHVVI